VHVILVVVVMVGVRMDIEVLLGIHVQVLIVQGVVVETNTVLNQLT
jgi:hypothetical protein